MPKESLDSRLCRQCKYFHPAELSGNRGRNPFHFWCNSLNVYISYKAGKVGGPVDRAQECPYHLEHVLSRKNGDYSCLMALKSKK